MNKQRQDVLKSIPLLLSYNLATGVGIKTTFPSTRDDSCSLFFRQSRTASEVHQLARAGGLLLESAHVISGGISWRTLRAFYALLRTHAPRVSPYIDAY